VRALWLIVAAAVASASAGGLALLFVGAAPRRLLRRNHAGRMVPAVLGMAFVGALVAGSLAARIGEGGRPGDVETVVLVGAVAMGVAGLIDDLLGHRGARGLLGHLAGLVRGHLSTGLLKLAVGVGAGVALSVWMGGPPIRIVATAVLVPVAANLWNGLDVRPGRSLKWAIVVLLPVLAASRELGFGHIVAAALGGAVGILPFDLLERGMLGDAGSNPLGLVVGAGLAIVLPTAGVVGAAAVALALQVAAETVTLSRLIDGAPPLRWFDLLGRRSVT
jgi:UDP-GlcNAc:undecaprenyl-phosphate GlcNAc-1-phosphate transferase